MKKTETRDMQSDFVKITDVWKQYEQGRNYLTSKRYYETVDKCYKFYSGDQWSGEEKTKYGEDELPVLNFIKPVVQYKASVITQNGMSIRLTPENTKDIADYLEAEQLCEQLNADLANMQEQLSFDDLIRDIAIDSAIAGDKYGYQYADNQGNGTAEIQLEQKDGTNILLGDENTDEIQSQPFILIPMRDYIQKLRDTAREFGADEETVKNIVTDTDTQYEAGEDAKEEVQTSGKFGKCTCVLKLWKEKNEQTGEWEVWMTKCTRLVEVIPPQNTRMTRYPLFGFVWDKIKGFSRGKGEVKPLIANQTIINKNKLRESENNKSNAYPQRVINGGMIDDLKSVGAVGMDIVLNKPVDNVKNHIDYLMPPQVGNQISNFVKQMMGDSRDLSGGADVLYGNVNPEKASGAAIVAARDAASVPLNRQMSKMRKMVEDMARNWIDIKLAYSTVVDELGQECYPIITSETVDGQEVKVTKLIPKYKLKWLKYSVHIDVSPTNYYSKFAEEQALERLLNTKQITFEQYAKGLPDDSIAPKAKLIEFAKENAEKERQIQAMQAQMAQMNNTGQQGGQVPPVVA